MPERIKDVIFPQGKPLVSISCITYNHEFFIRDCLNGFMMQKTAFPFEVLIHDDASTDHTAEIIREYEKKYPNIIKPIYETENQFSKGIRCMSAVFNFPRAQGKYIALCEGDDYWTDPLKLQKQFDFMEKNNEYSICCHNALVYDLKTNKSKLLYQNYPDCDFSLAYIITNKDGLMRTASMFFRSEFIKYYELFKKGCPVGDLALAVSMATRGKVHYCSRTMSLYRFHAIGSWTSLQTADVPKLLETATSFIDWFETIREFVQSDDAINIRISRTYILANFYKKDYNSYKNIYSKLLYQRLSITGRFLFVLFYMSLFVYSFFLSHTKLNRTAFKALNRLVSIILSKDTFLHTVGFRQSFPPVLDVL